MPTVHCGHANSPGAPVMSRRAFIVAGGRRGNKVIIGRKLSDRPEKKKKGFVKCSFIGNLKANDPPPATK